VINRWHRAVKTATFTIGEYSFENRRQGAPSITSTVFSYPGMAPFLEELLRGLVDLKQIQAWVEKAAAKDKVDMPVLEKEVVKRIATTVITRLQSMGLDLGDVVGKVMTRFPDLIAQLLAQGVVLEEGETIDDVHVFIDSLSFSEVRSFLSQWYQLNLEELVGPLVAKARAAQVEAAAKDEKKKNQVPAFKSGFSTVGR